MLQQFDFKVITVERVFLKAVPSLPCEQEGALLPSSWGRGWD